MGTLIQEKCVACRRDAPKLSDSEIAQLKPETQEWQVLIEGDIPRLNRVFSFKNFAEALAFTHKVGELAESEGHHPAILTEWGRVTVSWWTHKIRGLHRNDFIMAAKTDAFFAAVLTEGQCSRTVDAAYSTQEGWRELLMMMEALTWASPYNPPHDGP